MEAQLMKVRQITVMLERAAHECAVQNLDIIEDQIRAAQDMLLNLLV